MVTDEMVLAALAAWREAMGTADDERFADCGPEIRRALEAAMSESALIRPLAARLVHLEEKAQALEEDRTLALRTATDFQERYQHQAALTDGMNRELTARQARVVALGRALDEVRRTIQPGILSASSEDELMTTALELAQWAAQRIGELTEQLPGSERRVGDDMRLISLESENEELRRLRDRAMEHLAAVREAADDVVEEWRRPSAVRGEMLLEQAVQRLELVSRHAREWIDQEREFSGDDVVDAEVGAPGTPRLRADGGELDLRLHQDGVWRGVSAGGVTVELVWDLRADEVEGPRVVKDDGEEGDGGPFLVNPTLTPEDGEPVGGRGVFGSELALTDYQRRAMTTRVYRQASDGKTAQSLLYACAEVGDNAGALLGEAKKRMRDDKGMTRERKARLVHKLGGVLWGCAAVADELGVALGDVAVRNLDVLADRAARGMIRGDGWQR